MSGDPSNGTLAGPAAPRANPAEGTKWDFRVGLVPAEPEGMETTVPPVKFPSKGCGAKT